MSTAVADDDRRVVADPVLLRLTPHQAADLPRWIPHLVADVRSRLAQQPAQTSPSVTIDLSALPASAACAPLLFLFGLVRRLVGTTSEVVVTGVNAALGPCLLAGLPAGVTVIDHRRRRWSA